MLRVRVLMPAFPQRYYKLARQPWVLDQILKFGFYVRAMHTHLYVTVVVVIGFQYPA